MSHLGIDYGSKMAGTTAIAYLDNGDIKVIQSQKNKDADALIIATTEELKPKSIYIDAPLSLPLAYFQQGDNYFYRECDRALKAMSPMFLGGLTARAMRLKDLISRKSISVFETYPKALVHTNELLKEVYLKKNHDTLTQFNECLQKHMGFSFEELSNWHQVDAVLAWWSGQRFNKNEAVTVGNENEGQIIY